MLVLINGLVAIPALNLGDMPSVGDACRKESARGTMATITAAASAELHLFLLISFDLAVRQLGIMSGIVTAFTHQICSTVKKKHENVLQYVKQFISRFVVESLIRTWHSLGWQNEGDANRNGKQNDEMSPITE